MPAPPTRPRLRERYDRRRQAVLDTAARVFADRGYAATSMNDLIEATGLAAGGLYHYIGNKEQLLFTLFEQLTDPLLEEAERILASEAPAEHRLRELVRVWMHHVEHHRNHMLVWQKEWNAVREAPGWPAVRDGRKRFERILYELIDRVHEETGKPKKPEVARLALLGMVNWTPQWFDPEGPLTAGEIADGYCDLILGRSRPRRRAAERPA